MRVLAPSSTQELQKMLSDALSLSDTGPVVIRYPKGIARSVDATDIGSGIAARKLRTDNGKKVCILAVGKMVGAALSAAELLQQKNIDATVWDVRSCSPLDENMIADAASHDVVVTAEDGIRDGGIGMSLEDRIHGAATTKQPHISVLGVPTQFIPHAKPDVILAKLGLDAEGIAQTVQSLITNL
jgi:1-deoxy-D-xylulose-5-phosphate synthase